MDKKYYLFDLDGTLTDPKEGITKSVSYALKSYGIDVQDLDTLNKFIGPPLLEAFIEYYGFSEAAARGAIEKYRERYSRTGIFENKLYDGIEDTLKKLVDAGKTLLVATSKPTFFATKILDHFGIAKYFKFVAGSELDGTRTKKSEVIKYALESMGITDLAACVMIGDRMHDIIGAKETGLESVGVLYGYGSREELEAAGADKIAESIESLCILL